MGTIESKKLDAILELYFKGESSTSEEKMLRRYFNSADIAPEHKRYAPLFEYLQEEIEQVYEVSNVISPAVVGKKRFGKFLWLSGVAAAVLLFITTTLYFTGEKRDKMYSLTISGVEVNDEQLAIKILKDKLSIVNSAMDKVGEQTEKMTKAADASKQLERIKKMINEDNNR